MLTDVPIGALSVTCTHAGGPLDEGHVVADGCISCPWHASGFRLTDGKVDARAGSRRPAPKVASGRVYVRSVRECRGDQREGPDHVPRYKAGALTTPQRVGCRTACLICTAGPFRRDGHRAARFDGGVRDEARAGTELLSLVVQGDTSPLDSGGSMSCADGFGLRGPTLAQVYGEGGHAGHCEQFGLPVLQAATPEVGGNEIVAPADRGLE